jgi:hypothetical protein
MRKPVALVLGVLLPLLGLSGISEAQSSVQVQGVIQSVDCQGQAVVLSDTGTGISNTVVAAPYTPVLVGSTSVPFCTLAQYVGAPASAWLVANGNELVATRIDVLGPAAAAPPPVVAVPQPVPVPEPAYADVSPLPIVGIVLGTIAIAGLIYLLTHDRDDHYYRYPYYGAYYRHYYRPDYRPYLGRLPFAPIITVPPVIAGRVLGTVGVGGLEYLVARDRDGRFYRYPYYGPYRQHYYRAEYRPYNGPYRDVPVREGDPHWQGPARLNVTPQRLPAPPDPGRAPAWQGPPPRWNQDPRNNPPGPQSAPPRWTPPVVQNAPAPSFTRNGPPPGPPVVPNDRYPRWNQDPRNNPPGPQSAPPRWTPPVVQNAPAPSFTRNGPPPGPPAVPNDRYPRWNQDPRNNPSGPQSAPPRWTPPVVQNAPAPSFTRNGPPPGPPAVPSDRHPRWNQDPHNNPPGPQSAPPRWTPPAVQNAPAPSFTRNGPPPAAPQGVPNDRRRDGPSQGTPRPSCGSQDQSRGCGSGADRH